MPYEICQGGESNSRPTPNAFGAALPLEMINGELGIFLPFQNAFQLANLRHFFLRYNLEFLTKALVVAVWPRRCCAKWASKLTVEPM